MSTHSKLVAYLLRLIPKVFAEELEKIGGIVYFTASYN